LIYAAAEGVTVGPRTVIEPGARVRLEHGGAIVLGARCNVHCGAMLLSYGGSIRLGDNVSVNPYCILYGHGGLTIGNDVRIAAHCVVVPANHGTSLGRSIASQPETRRGIHIGNDVWIGAGARILDGSLIADGCVVAAGAVVTGILRANGIYGGVPARLLRERSATSPITNQEYPNDAAARDASATVAAS
jgi:acetyltransferase-like isoleucine patch superfamily enzyme